MINRRASKGLLLAFFTGVGCNPLIAATLIHDFNHFTFSGRPYGSWDDAGITTFDSGPESFNVTSRGFGGGFYDIDPQINAFGEIQIELAVTVDAGGSLPGVVLALVDGDDTLHNYAWYALTDGNHLLTKIIGDTTFPGQTGSVPGLDLMTLDFFHIQVDGQSPYRVSYNNLALTIPEPASLGLAAVGFAGLLSRRVRNSR